MPYLFSGFELAVYWLSKLTFQLAVPTTDDAIVTVCRQDSHKTCPICRAVVNSSKESWVLSEKPDDLEVAHEATGYVMGLIDSHPNDSDSSDVE